MRIKYAYLYLFFFLFLIITSNNVLAFTQFNTNPDFTSTYTGVYVLNQCNPVGGSVACNWFNPFTWLTCLGLTPTLNTAFDVSYNSTGYNGATGILLLNPSSNCTWTGLSNDILLNLKMLNGSEYYNSKEVPTGNSSWTFTGNSFALPKNQEGIISVKFHLNSTTNFDSSVSVLQWYDSLGGSNYTFLTSDGSLTGWANVTAYIPANLYNDREINIFLSIGIKPAYEPIQVQIDRFSFYTYDLIEPRESYWGDVDTEKERYCIGSEKGSGFTNSTFTPMNPSGYKKSDFVKYNQTLKLAIMVQYNNASLGGDNNYCCAFQSGNFSIVRRCNRNNGGNNDFYYMRDLALFVGAGTAGEKKMLLKKISTNSITFDFYYDSCNSVPNEQNIEFNGAGRLNWSQDTNFCGSFALDKTVNIASYNASGSKFKSCFQSCSPSYSTPWENLFNFQYITSYSCTCTDNIETCTDETGTIATTDCGCYDCDSNAQYCANPTITNSYGFGTFCYKTINPISTNTRGYITYFDYGSGNCSIGGTYGTCNSDEYCYQSETNSVSCLKISDNSTSSTVDSLGVQHSPETYSESLASGKLEISGLACDFGTGSGFGCDGGKFFIGMIIFLSILGSLNGIDMMYSKKHKFLPKEINVIIIVMLLVGLTIFIPLFNPLMLIIVVIFGIVLLASKIIPTVTPHSHEGG